MKKTMIAMLAALAVASWMPAPASARVAVEFQEDEAGRAREERYQTGQRALDEGRWEEASEVFGALAEELTGEGLANGDAALYWQAWALSKQSRDHEAQRVVRRLERSYPESPWLDDARALAAEAGGAGQATGDVTDDELKLYAVNGLMNVDPARAIPVLEEVLAGDHSSKIKDRALFVLSQSGEPRAYEILARVARDGKGEQRRQAINYLGMSRSEESLELLAEIYEQSADVEDRKRVLHGLMIAGDAGRLGRLARLEGDRELRKSAIHQLGVMGAGDELRALYEGESDPEVRRIVLNSFFLAGVVEPLARAAREDSDAEVREFAVDRLGMVGGEGLTELRELWREAPAGAAGDELRERILHAQLIGGDVEGLIAAVREPGSEEVRRQAIHNLGLVGDDDAREVLRSLYGELGDVDSRRQLIEAFFLASDARGLIEVIDREADPELQRFALQRLSMVDSPEASEYLLRALREEGS